MSDQTVQRLPDSAFRPNHGAESAHVFLWQVSQSVPFMIPVPGWKIVGYGKAPYEGSTNGFAAMFEKMIPADKEAYSGLEGQEYDEGTRIWQHAREAWVPGTDEYEGRMTKAKAVRVTVTVEGSK